MGHDTAAQKCDTSKDMVAPGQADVNSVGSEPPAANVGPGWRIRLSYHLGAIGVPVLGLAGSTSALAASQTGGATRSLRTQVQGGRSYTSHTKNPLILGDFWSDTSPIWPAMAARGGQRSTQ